jgi:signal transduction histidine kinase/ActR/RegA family two-component response regulator
MAESNDRSTLTRAIERIRTGDHLCTIYENQAEQFAAVVPFIRVGLERGEQCLYIADHNTTEAVPAAMRQAGIDVDSAMASGALVILISRETYLREGRFDPDAMIRFLMEATESAKAAGFSALRATREMTWALGPEPGVERLVEYEAKLNSFLATAGAVAICQYNRQRFPPALISNVIQTHPHVVFGGLVCKNSYYVPPEEFLNLTEQARLNRLLENVVARERAEAELRAALEEVETSQQHLVRAERLRALGQLAGGVAHDFNNTLAIILGRAELLLAQARSPHVRRQLQVIQKAALDGARTVKRIEEFTRMKAVRPVQLVNLDDLVEEVVEIARSRWKDEAQAKGIPYDVVLEMVSASLPPVVGDPSELREALLNVVFNALDAMPEGGQITFKTGVEEGRVYCAVTDTGIGMTEEVRQRIFDPFFTTKGDKGSGLGLSVVYGIITRHGGEIDVQSQVERGATFTIRLPAARLIQETVKEEARPRVRGRAKVLVVEDELEVREVLRDMLAGQGHVVVVCPNGEAGLRRFQEEPFDLVITDLGMRGLSGWEVVEGVRAWSPETPVILLTGWGDRIDSQEARARGVDFLVSKPFKGEDLRTALARALENKPLPAGS